MSALDHDDVKKEMLTRKRSLYYLEKLRILHALTTAVFTFGLLAWAISLWDKGQATAGDVWNGTEKMVGAGPDYDFGASPQLIEGAGGRKLVGEGQKSGTYWALDRATLDPVWSAICALSRIAPRT